MVRRVAAHEAQAADHRAHFFNLGAFLGETLVGCRQTVGGNAEFYIVGTGDNPVTIFFQ